MNTKNVTDDGPTGAVLLILLAGGVSSSIAAAWLASTFGPPSCDHLTFSAALDRVPMVLNLAIFLATVFVTSAVCRRLNDPPIPFLSMPWLIWWWPIGAGLVGALLLAFQVPEHLWSSFASCTAELDYSRNHIHGMIAVAHIGGWFITLLLAAWQNAIATRVDTQEV